MMISAGKNEGRERLNAYFVESMATLWDNMRLLARKTEAEAEGLETDGALFLDIAEVV